MSERMSDERLKHIKDRYDHYGEAAVGGGELLVEIDALRAELAKAERERDSARADALEEAAKAVEEIADDRFREHGSTEPDTNASYYQGSRAEFYEAQDEENESCASAIRALNQKEPQT